MGIRVWLDDVRPMPKGFDKWCKDAIHTVNVIALSDVDHISFDHDLGEDFTGYDVAKWIEQRTFEGWKFHMTWDIHSSNPVGRKNIEAAMKSAEKHWS
jgi:hypothetical protein